MPRLKKDDISKGRVSSSEGKSAEELLASVESSVPASLTFNPHDLTEKIIRFGTMLTGINLYEYQLFPAYRTIYSIVTFEGASVTLLTSRQCIRKGSIIHTRDGKLLPIENHPDAWKTSDSAECIKLTSYLGHSIECTRNHPLFTRSGWKPAGEIIQGEEVACLVAWDKFETYDKNDFNDPTPEMYEVLNRANKETIRNFLRNAYTPFIDFFAPDYTIAQTIRETLNKLGFPALIEMQADAKENVFYHVTFQAHVIREMFEQFLKDPKMKLQVPYDFIGEDGEYYKFAPITDIESIGEHEVWDITVPDKHWFTCGGIKAHNCGKSETVSFVIVTLMVMLPKLAELFPDLEQFKHGFKAGVFAPQSEQVDNLHQRIRTRLGSENAEMIMADPDIDTNVVSYSRLMLDNGSVCSSQVASKHSKIEGKTLDLAVIDEAQDVDTMIATKSIEPMVSSTAGTIFRSGTTGTTKNNFYEEIQFNKKQDFKIKNPKLKNHYQYDYKAIIKLRRKAFEKDGKKYHLLYEKSVLKLKKRWGENADAWKLAYALIWTLESGMFCTDDKFNKLVNKKMKREEVPIEGARYDMGIDWAKENNSTVVTVVRTEPSEEVHDSQEEYAEDKPKKTLVAWYEFGNSRYEDQHNMIMEIIHYWQPEVIAADATGVGAAPTDRIMWNAPEYVYVIPCVFSRPFKSQMWQNFEADMQQGRLIIPADKEVQATDEYANFYIQMTAAVRYYAGDYLVVHKGEKSMDDYLDSLGLAIEAANHAVEISDEIEEDENPFYQSGGDIYNRIYGNRL